MLRRGLPPPGWNTTIPSGDLLTEYNGNAITYDEIGNPLSDGTNTYTWKHGRQLATLNDGTKTWTYTYTGDGLRTKRTDGTNTYSYVYNGDKLTYMTLGSNKLYFGYDASGTPLRVYYNGVNYYYVTNLQGDVIAILNKAGTAVVEYTYDAWGNILTTTGSMASTLGAYNPLRYRGYVYDQETNLYYLQSRYYNPKTGRFLNADAFTSTGQGLTGNNMFAYCNNNPVIFDDPTGHFMTIMDFLNRSGGPTGVISGDSGGGGYSTSYDIAHSDLSVTNKVPSFSPGKRDPQELWNEIKDDIMSLRTAADSLPEKYPGIKLYQGGKDIYSGISNIRTGIDILLLPIPSPVDEVSGVIYCIYGVLEAAGGLVKTVIAVDRLE